MRSLALNLAASTRRIPEKATGTTGGPQRAANGPFEGTVAHGYLTLCASAHGSVSL
jgi:hypothetical protein